MPPIAMPTFIMAPAAWNVLPSTTTSLNVPPHGL
jgi:hypothetical protein